ncbi:hypothetical protein PPTG_07571 [Phytophthora nicotianae INRA-310]|uniref:PiggyBac transposable element-derived protein domain-containing protein n=1 Tax=Phytophthora nicotianae (strain INRA-310) TaxID=761204 RepID=W2QN34_PHYN3|nr:hypothetical protein PPTG_07571 [Phytophthora nicotianae INRA-310]ETN14543.1 hypothetical protein PPTG_07571 [Phytophthora nicotianae INRA-310]
MVRIRSSTRGKTDAGAAVARDIDFKHFWRQLRAVGWTSKKPSGFETEWRYKTPNGVEVFVGEDAVVRHAIESGLLATSEDEEEKTEDNASPDIENVEDRDIRVSQIDTSAQLSQHALDDLFGASSDSDVELSHAAVLRAFGLSSRELEDAESHLHAATSLYLLSEASGIDSDAERDGVCAETSGPVLRSLSNFKQDVNFVPDDANLSSYESLSSGRSDSDGVIDSDEDAAVEDTSSDDDVISDADAPQMDEAFVESLLVGQDGVNKNAAEARANALRATKWTPVSSEFEDVSLPYPGLNDEVGKPVPELRSVCHSPLLTLFYYMPKSLWVMINAETNRYSLQQIEKRAQAIHAKQLEPKREILLQIRRRLKAKAAYQTHEILQVLGLLIARMLCPQKRRFAARWSMTEDGAVPAGTFGRFMGRNRFQDILRDLHFVDNEGERPRDKLWKLRPVVTKLQDRFLAGWSLPAVFSFDEGVLPSISKRNTTPMFMPDKPHRYGTKMFMTCDARTAYCHRFEMYAGKRNTGDTGDSSFDHKTGAAAVVRNLKSVLHENRRHPWHLVVIDRFYSSVLLAIELLGMRVYVLGAIMTDRLGYDKNIKAARKTRPESIPRGAFTFSRSVAVPTMVAFHWWDSKPVHYLCTGTVMSASSINRNVKRVGPVTVPCPAAATDYQRWMGGVDVHDQLRLQKFSLQTSTKFNKYYMSLFLGLVDLALVNAYISHKETARITGTTATTRGDWYCILQNQLLQLKPEDFDGAVATPPPLRQKRQRTPVRLTHQVKQSEDWVTVSGVQKRRQRSCKVCALLRTDRKKKSYATTFFCERCSLDNAKCWLCSKIRHTYKGEAKTCFGIWHDDFDCGQAIPATLGKRVVLRRPGKIPGMRKKTRRELQLHNWKADDEGSRNENDNAQRVQE